MQNQDNILSIGYTSIEEAAAAFGDNYYSFTRETGRECGANLYACPKICGKVRYFYAKVRFGTPFSVVLDPPDADWMFGRLVYVGCVHTHPPNLCARFSGSDVSAFRNLLQTKPKGRIFEAFLIPSEDVLIRFVNNNLDWEEVLRSP